jgi:hypothetical protein
VTLTSCKGDFEGLGEDVCSRREEEESIAQTTFDLVPVVAMSHFVAKRTELASPTTMAFVSKKRRRIPAKDLQQHVLRAVATGKRWENLALIESFTFRWQPFPESSRGCPSEACVVLPVRVYVAARCGDVAQMAEVR